MGEATEIEWADRTVNFAWGCTKVSVGCDKCYMFRLSRIYGRSTVFTPRKLERAEADIRKWKTPSIVFVNSMTDTFHEDAPYELIDSWFDVMRKYSQHQYIILTKRINKAYQYFKTRDCPDQCWIGTSIENSSQLHRLRTLKKIKTKIRFVSFEPLLADIQNADFSGLQWVIVGGESDQSAPREFKEEWAIHIRDSCREHDIPFFYKQFGGKRKSFEENLDGTKKKNKVWGTNILDGKKYLEMPIALSTKESTGRAIKVMKDIMDKKQKTLELEELE